MKNLFILILLLIGNLNVKSQASYYTQIAFILRTENNEKISYERFKEEYTFADVYGNIISNDDLENYFEYDEKTNYLLLNLTTIGPRFSFALFHNNSSMIIYLPFKHEYDYYALDFKFRPGRYLFDYSKKDKEKIFLNSNMPYYLIEKINWRKQKRRLMKSNYAADETYNKKGE